MLFSRNNLQGMFQQFSTPVVVNLGTVNEFIISAIFDHPHADFGEDGQFSGRKAVLRCRKSVSDKLAIGNKVRVEEANYRVSDIQPDESTQGYMVVELKND